MNSGILLACQVENIASRRDGTIKIVLGTQELSQSKAGELFGLQNKIACAYISPKDTIPQKELSQVDEMEPDLPGKSPSNRMRNVLFLLWKQDQEGYKEFDPYYRSKMEVFIENLKNNIIN